MILIAFTLFHVLLSLIGIVAGFVVLFGLIGGKSLPGWTPWFLWTTIATSVTGFFFPFKGITPGIIIGVLSLIVLFFTLHALYQRHLAGGWRRTYVITAAIALYFNTFVLIVQSFQKVPSLHMLAPIGNEPAFIAAQVALLVAMIVLGTLAVKRFKSPSIARSV